MTKFPKRLPSHIDLEDINLDEEEIFVGGKRLTEKRAESLSQRVAGRPSLTAPGKQSPMLAVRVPASMKAEVERIATNRGVRSSDIVREAIAAYIA